MNPDRGMWGSRTGFILAAAGSAVGLGNVWAFPTQVGRAGGATFVLVYLLCVILVCFPIMVVEIAMGRASRMDPVGAFQIGRPRSGWRLAGLLAVVAPAGILSFYAVIAGWMFGYVWLTASGAATEGSLQAEAFFREFRGRPVLSLGLTGAVLGMAAAAVGTGVRGGIERVTRRLMPALFVLLVVLGVRALTLPGATQGLVYYLAPRIEPLADPGVFSAALGQAFFSLSLGMGIMITYGSYLDRRESIVEAALWVIGLDTAIALLAGFIIFPAGFSIAGFDPEASGPGLIFFVLPSVFAGLPHGQWFGAAFFVLLSLAAVTSAISLLEVPVAHLIDEYRWRRPRATLVVTSGVLALAVPSVLAGGATGDATSSNFDFLSLMVTVWNNLALPVGGFLVAVFVGRVWTVGSALDELRVGQGWVPVPAWWGPVIRYLCPAATGVVVLETVRGIVETLVR